MNTALLVGIIVSVVVAVIVAVVLMSSSSTPAPAPVSGAKSPAPAPASKSPAPSSSPAPAAKSPSPSSSPSPSPAPAPAPAPNCPIVDRQTSVSVGCGGYVYALDQDCSNQCGQCSNKIKLVTDDSNGGKINPCSVARSSPVYLGCGYGYFDKGQFDKQCGQLSGTGKWIGDSLPKNPASYIRVSQRNNYMHY